MGLFKKKEPKKSISANIRNGGQRDRRSQAESAGGFFGVFE